MRISTQPPLHLAYCLNIHPGDTWEENFEAIRRHARAVRDRVAGGRPFGLGLRVGHTASSALEDPATREALVAFLAEERMYVFTINGFPYGRFHRGPVKEKVYQPDWRTSARRDYTNRLADLLSHLLPEGQDGSISTVPCSFKPWIIRAQDVERMVHHLSDCVAHLVSIEERTGREIHIGLEPEPGCYLESTEDAVRFFTEQLYLHGARRLQQRTGRPRPAAEALLRRHLGICLDTCHLAVQFEDLQASIKAFRADGIRISKLQLSAALQVLNDRSRIEALHPFVEPVYLHQVKAKTRHGALRSWNDLPEALHDVKDHPEYERLRIHFHVPLFWEGSTHLDTTAGGLDPAFFARLRDGITAHLEIETYTFDVLPPPLRSGDVVECLSREYAWVLARLGG